MTEPKGGELGRVRVYIACSVDGFIAAEDGDLSWLPGGVGGPSVDPDAPTDPGALHYEDFIKDVGVLLMGRGCFDTVAAMEAWPYACPVLVATHRALDGLPEGVRGIHGAPHELLREAHAVARGKDIYLDGGQMIGQFLDSGLIDELVVTQIPVVLGAGRPLFANLQRRHRLQLVGHHRYFGSMLQLHFRPVPNPT